MVIHGLQKTTLLDFPEHLSALVFTGGCNLRCPFCQNKFLVLDAANQPVIDEEEVFTHLRKRQGILEGLSITGGEPTLQKGLCDFIKKVKDMGYPVKLDSNGCYPEVLRKLIDDGLVDYIAMDIKNSPEKYAVTCGLESMDLAPVRESVSLLTEGRTRYEFRTTVISELHEESDFEQIGEWISGAEQYFIQSYKDSGNVIKPGFSAATPGELVKYRQIMEKYVKIAEIRGVDL